MKVYFGKSWSEFAKNRAAPWETIPGVVWNSDKLQNGHTLVIGRPGAGKTTLLKRMIAQMQDTSTGVRFHVFDVHGDIEIPGASEVMFSEFTPYGLNPLKVGEDKHFGGVRKCIQTFIRTVSRATGNLGARQEAVLRKLLEDVYRRNGFDAEKPETWHVDPHASHLVSDGSDNRLYLDVPFPDKDDAKALGAFYNRDNRLWWVHTEAYTGAITRWKPKTAGRMHPSLKDVLVYAQRLLTISFMGSDQEAITKLDIFQKAAASHQRKELEMVRAGGVNRPSGDDDSESPLGKAKGKAIESYIRFIESVRTGRELEERIKYDDVGQLKSVVDRLETLRATGLFKPEQPPFDENAPIWRYKLNALSREEKKMFVMFRLQELFYAAIERGHQDKICDVLVLDEVALYVDEGGDDILTIIAREARKFGISVLAAAQDSLLPQGFIASLATKIVLGIDRSFWAAAATKMGLAADTLKWIQPKETFVVQMQDSSPMSGEWQGVMLRSRPVAGPMAPGVTAPKSIAPMATGSAVQPPRQPTTAAVSVRAT